MLAIVLAGAVGPASAGTGVTVVPASGVRYSVGDVFAATGNGRIKHFSSTGTLLDTLDSGTGSNEDTGMAFDPAGNLYSTQFTATDQFPLGHMVKFDDLGNPTGGFGSGFNSNPESVVRDNAGNFYVGEAGQDVGLNVQDNHTHDVLKFDPNGNLLTKFEPDREARGTDWIDLAADQCTLFYTSEGRLVKRFNVCTKTQLLPDFAALPITGGTDGTGNEDKAFALRIRPNQEVMVATSSVVFRLSPGGAVLQQYTFGGVHDLFALNLDSDGTSFWTGDQSTGQVFKVDINSGAVLTSFNTLDKSGASLDVDLGGLAVFGEVTAAQPKLTLSPASATRQGGQSVTLTAQLGNVVNPNGTPVTFTVTGANPQTGTGIANTDGVATFTYTGAAAGTDTVVATANPASNPGVVTSNPATINWTVIPTLLTYTGDTFIANGTSARLSAVLTEAGDGPLGGRATAFTLGSGATVQTCTAVTLANGTASCTIALVNQPLNPVGTVGITAAFRGDPITEPANASAFALLEFHTGRAFGFSARIDLPWLSRNVPSTPDTGEVTAAEAGSLTPPCVQHTGALAAIDADALCANVTTSLAPGTSTVTSSVDHISIAVPELPVIIATTVRAASTTTCAATGGTTTIASLTVGGQAVNTNVGPDTTIPLGGSAQLAVDEQVPVPDADNGTTVNALHLTGMDGALDVIVASATSDAHNCANRFQAGQRADRAR